MQICLALIVLIFCACSKEGSNSVSTVPAVDSAYFAVLESELTPAILVHSRSKYLTLFADTDVPSHIAFASRTGPRSFRRGEKLKADEMEECWLLLWETNMPPWVVYLQRKPLALTLDVSGLHLSFANGAGDVVLLPLHGSSTNVDTQKWPEFLPKLPLMRIRYWASVLREFPIECDNSLVVSNETMTVQQKFQFHSIRDDWKTRSLKLAPVSPPLAMAADEDLKRKLTDLDMPTPFGAYMGFEGVADWTAKFPRLSQPDTNCPWASFPVCTVQPPNTVLIARIETNGWPRVAGIGAIKASREQPATAPKTTVLNSHSRLISYQPVP